MIVKKVSQEHFKNIKTPFFVPKEGVNIIIGKNGQGKTNLLELIFLAQGGDSFRPLSSDKICFDESFFSSTLIYEDSERENEISFYEDVEKKEFKLNNVVLKTKREKAGGLCVCAFSSADIDIIKGGNEFRRKFLDDGISQIKPVYSDYLLRYRKALLQRNEVLKKLHYRNSEFLFAWNSMLAATAVPLLIMRNDYVAKLLPIAKMIYKDMIGNEDEEINFVYRDSVFGEREVSKTLDEDDVRYYEERLAAVLDDDIGRKTTTIGPHRDDVYFTINGKPAREYASGGQRRCGAIALRLAGAELCEQVTGESPVVLLDDVFSELDEYRQRYLIESLCGRQVFITMPKEETPLRIDGAAWWNMINGEIS
jgi:recF protein